MKHRKPERKTEADAEERRGTWIIYNRGQALEFAECSECGHEQEPNIVLMCTTYPNKCPACKTLMGTRTTAEKVDEGTWMPESCKGK